MSRYGYFEEPELKVTVSATFGKRQFGELEFKGKGAPIVFYMLLRYSI